MFAALLIVAAQPPLVIPAVGLQPPAAVVPVTAPPPLEAPPLILPPVPAAPKPAAPPAELLPPPLKDSKGEPKSVQVPKPAELLPPPLKEFTPDPKAAKPPADLPPPPLKELKPLELPKPAAAPPALELPKLEFPKPAEPAKTAPTAPPVKSASAPPPVKAAEPVFPLPGTPTALSVKPTAVEATPAAGTSTPAPGDTPMPLTVRQMALTAVVSTAMLTAPLQAKQEPKVESAKAGEVAVLKKQVEDLAVAVEQLKKSQSAIRELLEGTEKVGDEGLLKAIKKLDASVSGLDGKLKALDTKLDAVRTANASPLAGSANPATPTAAGKGTVRIVNEYPIDISMLVNGKPYKLSANTSKDVPVDVGTFKYQLLNSGLNEVVSPVKENETVTLRIK